MGLVPAQRRGESTDIGFNHVLHVGKATSCDVLGEVDRGAEVMRGLAVRQRGQIEDLMSSAERVKESERSKTQRFRELIESLNDAMIRIQSHRNSLNRAIKDHEVDVEHNQRKWYIRWFARDCVASLRPVKEEDAQMEIRLDSAKSLINEAFGAVHCNEDGLKDLHGCVRNIAELELFREGTFGTIAEMIQNQCKLKAENLQLEARNRAMEEVREVERQCEEKYKERLGEEIRKVEARSAMREELLNKTEARWSYMAVRVLPAIFVVGAMLGGLAGYVYAHERIRTRMESPSIAPPAAPSSTPPVADQSPSRTQTSTTSEPDQSTPQTSWWQTLFKVLSAVLDFMGSR